MNRPIAGLAAFATAAATFGLAAATVPASAGAATGVPAAKDTPAAQADPTAPAKSDSYPDPLADKRTAVRQAAVDQLVAGDAQTKGKGPDRTIEMASGTQVDYPVSQSAQLLTFLVQFGDGEGNAKFPENVAGPAKNEIPQPGADDNSTYWEPNFSREHYLDMFFNGLPDQNGESFRNVYKEMSSGRFDLQGDVSDWVTVEHPESYYQTALDDDRNPATPDTGEDTAAAMKAYIGDTAKAWFDAQKTAGMTDAQVKAYLAKFDVWDRYDFDGDGDFNEPDGYIDHFQAIHAGEGEEAGAPTWAIWSHRWAANATEKVGPGNNKAGGVQIGDTGYWIRDYTTEPENGGLGVFAHEFGHDLGLPDYYDTQGGDNSTAFWTLMSQGSWNSHGVDAIGTTPNHMDAVSKLFLGWYGPDDLAVVDGTAAAEEVVLGPSYHATKTGAQAVAVTLPEVASEVDVVEPEQGTHYLYSGTGDDYNATATSTKISVPATNATFKARTSFSIEDGYDYAFLQASADGGSTWSEVPTNLSEGADLSYGIDGCSGTRDADDVCDNAWTDLTADLAAYAGKDVQLRFKLVTDGGYHEIGFSVDSITVGGTTVSDFEGDNSGWTLKGFRIMDGSTYEATYAPYYLAENRQYAGYDKTLAEGPYSFDYYDAAGVATNKVDHYKYQDGLLVWYVNPAYGDNNTLTHPGFGAALPVDSNPIHPLWTGASGNYYANSNLASRDATFDVDTTDELALSRNALGGQTIKVAAQQSVPVFDDSNVNGYFDARSARTQQYSTKVAGAEAMIQVVSSDEGTGRMVVKAGHRFVATTSQAAITGTPEVGQTLTAVAPTTFQTTGVKLSYQWQVGGKPVFGVTGSTYTVAPGDNGKKITAVVTASKAGYESTTQSASVNVGTQAAPVATTAPSITGTPVVGQKLAVTAGTWAEQGTSTFAWTVGTKAVGTGTSYVLQPGDAGKAVTVTETRTGAGYQPGTAVSAPTAAVAPATTNLSLKAPTTVKRNKKATITVTVTAPGLTPTGAVQAVFGGKSVKAETLVNGSVKIKLPKRVKKGRVQLVVTYVPDTGFTASSTTTKIRITRKG